MKSKPGASVLAELVPTEHRTQPDVLELWEWMRRLNETEERLREQGRTVIERIERALRDLDLGRNLNELGELQSTGFEFDRLVAQRAWEQRFVEALVRSLLIDEATKVRIREFISAPREVR